MLKAEIGIYGTGYTPIVIFPSVIVPILMLTIISKLITKAQAWVFWYRTGMLVDSNTLLNKSVETDVLPLWGALCTPTRTGTRGRVLR